MVVALALAGSSAEAVAVPVHASAAKRIDPRDVPVLSTKHAPPPAGDPAKPKGDFAPLSTLSGPGGTHFDPARSKLISRSMFSEEYVNPDGTHSVRQSTAPLNVRDAAGQWQPVDTGLQVDAGSKRAVAKRHVLNPSLASRADDPALVSVATDGAKASLRFEGAAPSPAKVNGSAVSYADVAPDTDLDYEVTSSLLKETVLVKRPPAAGKASWRFHLDVDGVTPELDQAGEVLFKDATGAVRMAIPPVTTWDSAGGDSKPPAITGGRYQLDRAASGWTLTVSVDEAWLHDPKRVYPVHVDPTWTFGVTESHAYKSDGYTCDYCALQAGNSLSGPNGGDTYWRTVFHFDYSSLLGKSVVGARLDLQRDTSTPGSVRTWNMDLYHAAGFDFNGVGAYLASGLIGDVGSISGSGLTNFLADRVNNQDTSVFFMIVGAELPATWTYKYTTATMVVDTGTAPPATSIVAPADQSVITSLTPTLSVNSVTDPDGDPVSYCFKVATGTDAKSGVVVDSGCLSSPTWTVPAGVLQDGTSYTWQVSTLSGITMTTPTWVGHFKVDQRIGAHGPSPVDTEGPVTVNLANGNVSASDAGPTFTTVGGSAGVTFSYNSQADDPAGLRASYFNDLSHNGNISPSQQPVLVRTEPQVNVDWGTDSPFPPVLPADYYVVRWEGYFQVPATGTYRFAGVHSGGAAIWINGNQVYNGPGPSDVSYSLTSEGGPVTEVALTGGTRVPIKVELYHSSGPGRMRLFVKTSDGTTVPSQLVPASWLSTTDLPALSKGWTMSADLDGSGTSYTKAQVLDQSIVLTDATGTKHTWTKKSTGGYTPPAGEDGVLGLDSTGRVTLHEGADVFVFNVDGTLSTQSSSVDSRKPAALQNIYSGTPLRLTQIKDPVSGRAHTLYYNIDGTNSCYGGATPPPGTDPTAPSQMLCRIAYWDGSETRIWYSGQTVARIENPGGDSTDYGYTSTTGPLIAVRSSLVNDWIAADPANRANRTDILTVVGYDNSANPKPKATSVTLPVPDGSTTTPRPAHSYRYDPPNQQSFVDVAGLSPAVGFAEKVTYDDADRTLTTTDATGKTTSHTWNVKDQPLTSTDTAGRTGVHHGLRLRRPPHRRLRSRAGVVLQRPTAHGGVREHRAAHPHRIRRRLQRAVGGLLRQHDAHRGAEGLCHGHGHPGWQPEHQLGHQRPDHRHPRRPMVTAGHRGDHLPAGR
ncbi:hypothetical protein GTS_44140 [Gandjariella thermophila]|uniref:PA14 domain-containing protein n=1 Tax=Gandjariella thermophila TaxID=1931992 RepID=A0A4D4J811_9PSEU|nr:hypothetical protein GTS_44140 [Gandjariella thermophila]